MNAKFAAYQGGSQIRTTNQPEEFRKWMMGVSLLIVCSLAAIPAMAQKPGAPQPLPVTVTNTPNVNVANTPSVSVSNTPNVNVTNTPSVSVTNTPSVNVANTPSVTLESGASVAVTSPLDDQGNPTPVAVLDAVQPYEDSCVALFNHGYLASCNFHAIPSDKQLVVQEFDGNGGVDAGLRPIVWFYGSQSATVPHYFVAYYQGSNNGYDLYDIHQDTRLYVAAGQTPYCEVFLNGFAQLNDVLGCDLSGYLVDVPPGGGSGLISPAQGRQRPPLQFGRPSRQPNNNEH